MHTVGMKRTRSCAFVLPHLWSVKPTGRCLGASIFLVAMLPAILTAQNGGWDSVNINGTWLQLGMKQAEVLSRLAENNTLKKTMENHWSVWPKGQAELTANMGYVGFIDEKLYTAGNELGTSVDAVAANLMNRLYMVISEAEKSGTPVQIHTQPEGELKTQQRIRTLSVFIGHKEFSIQIIQPVGISAPSFTTLQESVYQQQTPVPPVRK